MEIKYKAILYGGFALSLLMLISLFIKSKSKTSYSGGKKSVGIVFSQDDEYFKKKKIQYKLLSSCLSIVCILSMLSSCFLLSRPYRIEVSEKIAYNRDIFLCLDISTSVDEVNVNLVSKLKDVVTKMKGERFGIIIFNTSPVLICPLTEDYEYIVSQLDKLQECLEYRINGSQGDFYEGVRMDEFISSGTLVDNKTRGSSIIGDGLASTVINFTDMSAERTRVVIFATDNDLYGTEIFSLQEAAQLCKEKNIIVFGIGTGEMYNDKKEEMRQAMLTTGGKFYLEEEAGTFDNIVNDIETTSKSLVKSGKEYKEIPIMQLPFVLLLISISSMFVLIKISRK